MDITSEDDGDDDKYPHWLNPVSAAKRIKDAKCIMLEKEKTVFQIDTGATVNMLTTKYGKHIKL